MKDITTQTEDELQNTIARAQQTITLAEAELKERKEKVFSAVSASSDHFEVKEIRHPYIEDAFCWVGRKGKELGQTFSRQDAEAFWEWLGKRLGKQTPTGGTHGGDR